MIFLMKKKCFLFYNRYVTDIYTIITVLDFLSQRNINKCLIITRHINYTIVLNPVNVLKLKSKLIISNFILNNFVLNFLVQ